ncbi:hypothetical protein B0H10DRAFT_2136772 [Mycena sp. CBHHK59/15]|nr:hypothetical protein B0H10DRAFT_2136772 [Mycena sp. CBHHK59/15]
MSTPLKTIMDSSLSDISPSAIWLRTDWGVISDAMAEAANSMVSSVVSTKKYAFPCGAGLFFSPAFFCRRAVNSAITSSHFPSMAPPFAKQLLVGCLPLHVAQFLLLIDDDVMGVTGFWAVTRMVSTPFALSAAIRACSRSTRFSGIFVNSPESVFSMMTMFNEFSSVVLRFEARE